MTDPKRLAEGGGIAAELLASAREDGPSRDARRRTAAALGIGLAVTTVSATARGGTIAKVIAAGVVVAALGGGVAIATREPPRMREPVIVPTAPASTAATASAAPAEAPVQDPDPVASEAAPVTVPARTPPATTAKKQGDLAREVRSLDAVRGARGAAALRELDRHDREFPRGALREEAAMLRVEALSEIGEEAAARRLARTLLDKDPSGPHARRLRSILGEAP